MTIQEAFSLAFSHAIAGEKTINPFAITAYDPSTRSIHFTGTTLVLTPEEQADFEKSILAGVQNGLSQQMRNAVQTITPSLKIKSQ